MNVIVLEPVRRFIDTLDMRTQSNVRRLFFLLHDYGHNLSMPYAKPIGGGLWELRKIGRPQIRILYGFCGSTAVVLFALKKQRSALSRKDITLAQKRLEGYCG